MAYGGSQARCRIRAVAAGLPHSHSNARSKPCLRPNTPAHDNVGSLTTEQGQGTNLIFMEASRVRFCCTTMGTPRHSLFRWGGPSLFSLPPFPLLLSGGPWHLLNKTRPVWEAAAPQPGVWSEDPFRGSPRPLLMGLRSQGWTWAWWAPPGCGHVRSALRDCRQYAWALSC